MNDATATTTSAGPYQITINLARIGNIIIYQFSNDGIDLADDGTSDEAIPVGYRPTRAVSVPMRNADSACGIWTVRTDGKATWYTSPGKGSVATAIAVYNTNDPWPSN